MGLGDESHSTNISWAFICGDDSFDMNIFLILLKSKGCWLVELECRVMIGNGISDWFAIYFKMNFGFEVDFHLKGFDVDLGNH